jgi:hypothetical protein
MNTDLDTSRKESIFELQNIDCNCNDCKHLFRLFDKQNNLLAADKVADEELFYIVREKKVKNIQENISSLLKYKDVINQADLKIAKQKNKLQVLSKEKYGYQGRKAPVQYGVCCKFKKEITFIANTLQLETQNCFEHRRATSTPPQQKGIER